MPYLPVYTKNRALCLRVGTITLMILYKIYYVPCSIYDIEYIIFYIFCFIYYYIILLHSYVEVI